MEEAFFKQTSLINWMDTGDQNTSYFQKSYNVRNAYNSIYTLEGLDGLVVFHSTDIGNLATTDFQSILGPPVWFNYSASWPLISSLTKTVYPTASLPMLSSIPLTEDIRTSLFRLNPNKSPGPDGFTSSFYKSAWTVLGDEVVNSISKFFIRPFMPLATNSTILTLVPKFPGATCVKDYRPISCCNTLYNVIYKLLVAKLKPILNKIILPNETAFIKGRQLMENCLLASEIVSGYHKDKGPKRIILKVDIAKAFDSISWDFIIDCLRALQHPQIYIQWITACLTIPSYSVGINGNLHGYFKGSRGLRQWDPISPYLFCLAMNILSQMLNDAAFQGKFQYHPKCKGPGLTHLCFADDMLIFSYGSPKSFQGILSVLQDFNQISGLAISAEKSCLFSSGLADLENQSLASSSRIPQ